MKRKTFFYLSLSCSLTALFVGLLISYLMFYNFTVDMRSDVKQTAIEYRNILNTTQVDALEVLGAVPNNFFRITLIDAQGEILLDNKSDTTENHGTRPEIMSAYESGFGDITRYSDTISQQTYYYAVLLNDGNVLRISMTTDSVYTTLLNNIAFIIISVLIGICISLILSSNLTKRFLTPINKINIEDPLRSRTYVELTPLLIRIEQQNNQLKAQTAKIEQMHEELSDIMENTEEGIIVLSEQGHMLSVNQTASKILNKDKSLCIGKHILEVHRGETFEKLFEAVTDKKNIQLQFEQNGKNYNVSVSNIESGGSVIMFFDVTQKSYAERMRREFSANVSHELKTPLQTISGYAELLKNNLVQDSDKPRFVENIYAESARMNELIEDIINLSHLDENAKGAEHVDVDVLDIVKQVKKELEKKAQNKGVSVNIKGESAVISAIPVILKECIFNITDNAIKYNNTNGKVDIDIENTAEKLTISVSDNGIGIPEDERERVFERFYRVDKSRSRDKGGTGLGLSIVKHAVSIHSGKLNLDSEEGKGTTITISFPKQ